MASPQWPAPTTTTVVRGTGVSRDGAQLTSTVTFVGLVRMS